MSLNPHLIPTGGIDQRITASIADLQRQMQNAIANMNEIPAQSISGGGSSGQIKATSVTTAEIAAGAITTTTLAAGAVTTSILAAGAVTSATIAAGTITAANIVSGTITTTQIAASTITGGNIAAGTITSSNILAGTITATQIAAGTITATQIAAATITTTNIASGAVQASQISVSSLSAVSAAMGTVTGGIFQTGSSGSRVMMGTGMTTPSGVTTGIVGIDIGSNVTFSIDASTGNVVLKGSILTGSTGLGNLQGVTQNAVMVSSGNNLIGNASADGTDLTPWNGSLSNVTSISRDTGTYLTAPASIKAIPGSGGAYGYMLLPSAGGQPCTPGQVFSTSVYVYSNVARTMSVGIEFFTATFGVIGNVGGPSVNVPANQWTRLYCENQTAPASSVYVCPYWFSGGSVNTDNYWFDNAMMVNGPSAQTSMVIANSITATEIAAGTITATQIAAGTITAAKIVSATITGTQIAAATIAASNIVTGTITGTQIAAGTITASKLTVSPGDQNQLLNSAFANWPTTTAAPPSWTAFAGTGTAATSADTTPSASGLVGNGWKLTQSVAGTIGYSYSGSTITVLSGQVYQISFWWKGNMQPTVSAPTGGGAWVLNPAASATLWQRYVWQINPSSTATYTLTITGTGTTSTIIAVTDVKFEQGDVATAWSQYVNPTVIDGSTITAAQIQSAVSGARIAMSGSANQFQVYNSSNTLQVTLDGTTGLDLIESGFTYTPTSGISWSTSGTVYEYVQGGLNGGVHQLGLVVNQLTGGPGPTGLALSGSTTLATIAAQVGGATRMVLGSEPSISSFPISDFVQMPGTVSTGSHQAFAGIGTFVGSGSGVNQNVTINFGVAFAAAPVVVAVAYNNWRGYCTPGAPTTTGFTCNCTMYNNAPFASGTTYYVSWIAFC